MYVHSRMVRNLRRFTLSSHTLISWHALHAFFAMVVNVVFFAIVANDDDDDNDKDDANDRDDMESEHG